MRNIRLTIAYDGTRYKGWQRQKLYDNTIQGKIEKVLSIMADKEIKIIGAGRTDAGVHAKEQIANFRLSTDHSLDQIQNYLNEYLPNDICVTNIKQAGLKFHSRYNTKLKRYKYRIFNNKYNDVFERHYSWHIDDKLDLDLMNEAAQKFIGKHDFSSVTSAKSKTKSMIRTIYSIKFDIKTPSLIEIIFEGDGFLHNMVRIITGTLVEVGLKEREVNSIQEMLEAKERKFSGPKAPAKGLFLEEIEY